MRPEFRGAVKKAIVADWAAAFPTLRVLRASAGSPALVRRVGPLVQGICLDRVSDPHAYRPTAFIHDLMTPRDSLGLGLDTVPRKDNRAEMTIRAGLHAREYPDAVSRVRSQFPLPFDVAPTLAQVVEALRRRIEWLYSPDQPGENLWPAATLILLPATLGRDDLVRTGLAYVAEISRFWRNPKPEYWEWRRDAWLESLAERAADPVALRATVASEIVVHRLERIHSVELA